MSKVTFKNQTGNNPELFPINIFDKIPENHLVRLVDSVVNNLNISDITDMYLGGGCSAYHPRMMIKVLFYNKEQDFYICTMGQKMEKIGTGKRISSNGYDGVSYYQAKRCENCPLRGMCHQSKGNRRIEVNHRLNELKTKAKELLTSEKGLEHRSKRPIEVEAVFGQLKNNNKFNRFTFKGLDKVELEFLLMALGHNFRKMAAKGATSKKIVVKVAKNGSKVIFEIEIYDLTFQEFYIQEKFPQNFLRTKIPA